MFIAASLPNGAVAALEAVAARLKGSVRGNYPSSKNYHITLAFLGETSLGLTEDIGRIIAAAAKGIPPVEVKLSELGFFGRRENAVLFCGAGGAEPLVAMSECIRDGLASAGIRFDPKPMKPHITLARKANLSGVDLGAYAPRAVTAKIDSVTLYLSHRVRGELTYTPIIKPVRLK